MLTRWHLNADIFTIELQSALTLLKLNGSQSRGLNKKTLGNQRIMEFESSNEKINIRGITELTAANAGSVKEEVRSRIRPEHEVLDIDMSEVRILDSSGLGTLISLHKVMCQQNGVVRILNPTPIVEQVLELTRLHRLLEITRQ